MFFLFCGTPSLTFKIVLVSTAIKLDNSANQSATFYLRVTSHITVRLIAKKRVFTPKKDNSLRKKSDPISEWFFSFLEKISICMAARTLRFSIPQVFFKN